MHTIPLPTRAGSGPERYAVAVVDGPRLGHFEAHVYFEHGGYAMLCAPSRMEAANRGHECGRTGKVPPQGKAGLL